MKRVVRFILKKRKEITLYHAPKNKTIFLNLRRNTGPHTARFAAFSISQSNAQSLSP